MDDVAKGTMHNEIPKLHPKDPLLTWVNATKLNHHCQNLLMKVDSKTWNQNQIQKVCIVQTMLKLQCDPKWLVLVELFIQLGIGLVTLLEVGLVVQCYIYVDNNKLAQKIANHH
jgi:hypothetical protein